MKKLYTSPMFLDGNGIITLTGSQLAALGCDQSVITDWDAFWSDNGSEYPAGFDVNNPDTWSQYGFVLSDPDTWLNPLGFV